MADVEQIKRQIASIAGGRKLFQMPDAEFFRSEWEDKRNGVKQAVIYTWTPELGPIATPVIWMPQMEGTLDMQLNRAIERIKSHVS